MIRLLLMQTCKGNFHTIFLAFANSLFIPFAASAVAWPQSQFHMCFSYSVSIFKCINFHDIKRALIALACVAQWIEHGPANQRVTGSSPSQGTYLGCRPGPQEVEHERQPHIDVSVPLFLPLFLPPFPSL